MEPVFESHAHYLYKLPLSETASLFRAEMELTGATKIALLSIPKEYSADGSIKLDLLQNVKGLFLKKQLSPDAYCLAGLVHPDDYSDTDAVAADFLSQIRYYSSVGFDGMKMLEGYPTFEKFTRIPLDSPVYDPFYSYAEEHEIPIVLHAANPDESWDPNTADQALIRAGRVYDGSYPSKEAIIGQVFSLLEKHPKLRLTLAHMGFFSKHHEDARRFMAYPNTKLDMTPGGEQFLNMLCDWETWSAFFDDFNDRLMYGTDFYAFSRSNEENWRSFVNLRPRFLRQFSETDTEHEYLGSTFRGVRFDPALREKLYMKNALVHYGDPKPIDLSYFAAECSRLEPLIADEDQKADLAYLKSALSL